jgi:hypothetical protein
MTVADRINAHRARCEPELLRLRMLAYGGADGPLPRQVATEVREATNAVIAEAEAAGRASLTANGNGNGQPAAETFLWVRLARLADAADKAVGAARTADSRELGRHLDRFDTLATAMWAVRHAVYGQAPAPWGAPASPPSVAGSRNQPR